jgi:hypothetical protein
MSDHEQDCMCGECWPYKPGSKADLEARLRLKHDEQLRSVAHPAHALAEWSEHREHPA